MIIRPLGSFCPGAFSLLLLSEGTDNVGLSPHDVPVRVNTLGWLTDPETKTTVGHSMKPPQHSLEEDTDILIPAFSMIYFNQFCSCILRRK